MQVKTNSLKAWVLAARPKTLTGAAAPVLVGATLGFCVLILGGMGWTRGLVPALFCFLFAILMQIDANFINDYFDFKKGSDTKERLGPERACSQGWISPSAMKKGIIATTALSILAGLPLICYGGWWMLAVGLLCVAGAFIYTTWFSYKGLGDVLVVIFFGIVPVFFTYHVMADSNLLNCLKDLRRGVVGVSTGMTLEIDFLVFIAGLAVGLVVNNLLIVNNYRDREQDALSGKKTLAVRFGARFCEWLYLANGILGIIGIIFVCSRFLKIPEQMATGFPFHLVVPLLFLPFLFSAHRMMVRINHGRELNAALGKTARNILIFSIIFSISIILTSLTVWYNG